MKFNTIEEAIMDIKDGKIIIVIDDPSRENEGDLLMAAEKVTPEAINFMATHGRGLICMPITKEKAIQLDLPQMTSNNTDNHTTAFTISVDHMDTTTGISAYERSFTIEKIVEGKQGSEFRRPGHVFPLVAVDGGVLIREGHTEAAVDFSQLAGLDSSGVICEIMSDDGTMAKTDELFVFAEKHNLKIVTIESLRDYRLKKKGIMIKVSESELPTKYGEFKIHGFINKLNGEHHVAVTMGEFKEQTPQLVRIHSECLTGDVFSSSRCDCGEQLDEAMESIASNRSGAVVYLRQEGRGIGLINKLKAYELQDKGFDTVDANIELGFKPDQREYNEAAEILDLLNIKNIELMTNNPEKINGLREYGIEVSKVVHIEPNHNEYNEFYLRTKKERFNHNLKLKGERK